jgi:hypothetical protein
MPRIIFNLLFDEGNKNKLSIIKLPGPTNSLINIPFAHLFSLVHKKLDVTWNDSKNIVVARNIAVKQDQSDEAPKDFIWQFLFSL